MKGINIIAVDTLKCSILYCNTSYLITAATATTNGTATVVHTTTIREYHYLKYILQK